jgi:hypothetical protein
MPRMLVMAAHEIRSLGQAATGTVDADYLAAWLVNGDADYPVRVSGGAASFTIPLATGAANGLVVVNHNLNAGTVVTFSGFGVVTAPAVPPGNIRRNAYRYFTTSKFLTTTTLTISGHAGDIILGDVYVGLFREVWPLPTETAFPFEGVQIRTEGEYHHLSYSKGAIGLGTFGGTIYVDDADYILLRDAYLGSEENSLPTVVVLYDDATFLLSDPIVVTWETWTPHPIRDDLWAVDIQWREVPRYRHAA